MMQPEPQFQQIKAEVDVRVAELRRAVEALEREREEDRPGPTRRAPAAAATP